MKKKRIKGEIIKEGYNLVCDWCSKEKGTICLYGSSQTIFRICLKCSTEVVEAITEEIKVQRFRHLIDTGEGIVFKEEEDNGQ